MVEGFQGKNFISDADCGGFVGVGEQGDVFGAVDEVLLEGEEVRREEDGGAEVGEEGV